MKQHLRGRPLAVLIMAGLTLSGLFLATQLAASTGMARNDRGSTRAAGRLLLQEASHFSLGGAAGGAPRLALEDFVVAIPTDDTHLEVARASRAWRKGVRTFIVTKNTPSEEIVAEGLLHNETWDTYPDDSPLRSKYPGDTRAALVPFLAHRHFGNTYKWLLYMDDDTIYFPDAVQRLLEGFDPGMPYFLTDHLWWTDLRPRRRYRHPHKGAPRCLPCHFDEGPYRGQKPAFPAPKGCPCTPQLLCSASAAAGLQYFDKDCTMPGSSKFVYSMHGGAGAIMSVGLMRKVRLETMESCIKSTHAPGSDAFISRCLWKAGYAATDPGPSLFRPDLQLFDPGPEDRLGAMLNLSQYIINKQCDSSCQLNLEHMVTLHARSRHFPTMDDAAAFIRLLSSMHELYASTREHGKPAAVH